MGFFYSQKCTKKRLQICSLFLELVIRLERTTCALRMRCTTDCATQATVRLIYYNKFQEDFQGFIIILSVGFVIYALINAYLTEFSEHVFHCFTKFAMLRKRKFRVGKQYIFCLFLCCIKDFRVADNVCKLKFRQTMLS